MTTENTTTADTTTDTTPKKLTVTRWAKEHGPKIVLALPIALSDEDKALLSEAVADVNRADRLVERADAISARASRVMQAMLLKLEAFCSHKQEQGFTFPHTEDAT